MVSIEVLDIKIFMQALLMSNCFDDYLLVNSTIEKNVTNEIDGHYHFGFSDEEDAIVNEMTGEGQTAFIPWKIIKPQIFELIKGKATPSLIKIVLKLRSKELERLIAENNTGLNQNDVDGCFLNITFTSDKLTLVCGASYKIFTMDKSLEEAFSNEVVTLLKSKEIACQTQ